MVRVGRGRTSYVAPQAVPMATSVLQHLDRGHISTAARHLSRAPTVAPSPELELLLDPHYPMDFDHIPRPHLSPPAVTISLECLTHVLESRAKEDPTPGPSGISDRDILAAVHADTGLARKLLSLVNAVANNELSAPARSALNVSLGVALFKDAKKVRPIAMAETVVNIAAACLVHTIADLISNILDPLDFGFGRNNGVESMAHTTRCAHELHPDSTVSILADLTSAFNLLSRRAIVETLSSHAPFLLRFFLFKTAGGNAIDYSSVSHRLVRTQHRGIPQGCPASPAIFCITYSVALRSTRLKHYRTVMITTYMDDTKLQGRSAAEVLAALADVEDAARSVGLTLNRSKTACYAKSPSPDDTAKLLEAQLTPTSTLKAVGCIITGDLPPFHAHCVSSYRALVTSFKDVVAASRAEERAAPPRQQHAHRHRYHPRVRTMMLFALLNFSVSRHSVHLGRSMPPYLLADIARDLDRLTLDAYFELIDERREGPGYTSFTSELGKLRDATAAFDASQPVTSLPQSVLLRVFLPRRHGCQASRSSRGPDSPLRSRSACPGSYEPCTPPSRSKYSPSHSSALSCPT